MTVCIKLCGTGDISSSIVVRVCALRSEGHRFKSLSLPTLLVEVSSPHIDPCCKECLIGPFGAFIPTKVYIIINIINDIEGICLA